MRVQTLFSFAFCVFLLAPYSAVQAQTGQVTGTVIDSLSGEPLPGVNVAIEGSQQGAATNAEGRYTITGVEPGTYTLHATFIGYTRETNEGVEVSAGETTTVDFALQQEVTALSEVVAVGYGTEREENLTGSVSTVTSADLEEGSASNVQNLLQGKAPGLQVIQGSGQPGDTETSLEIRGLGSYGASSDPLVLIDGVEGSLDQLNPKDVESVSVLKDAASAAIYGARAANGVILVTTKDGRPNELTFSYTNNLGLEQPTHLPDFIYNSAEYMEMYNRAAEHSNVAIPYPESMIEAYRQNQGSEQYPNFNWQDHMINDAFTQTHNLSVSGGGERTTYRTSLGYLDQNGIIPGFNYDRYTARLAINSEVNEALRIGSNVSLMRGDRAQSYALNVSEAMLHIYSQGPHYRPYLPDGSGRYTAYAFPGERFHNRNPAAIPNQGAREIREYDIAGQAFMDISFMPELIWSTKAAIDLSQGFSKYYGEGEPMYWYFPDSTTGEHRLAHYNYPYFEGVEQNNDRSRQYTVYSTLEYERDLNENNTLRLLGGTSFESFRFDAISALRRGFPTLTLTELNVGSEATQENSGTAYEWALHSFFGRTNYNYKDKYLLEANLRYDGSSRIAPDYRWGLFPSFSAAWRVSEENFFDDSDWLDNLKLRVSYGKLGNQQIGTYPYQQVLNLTSYTFGSTTQQGAYLQRLTDQSLRWETTTMLDVGVDYSMLNGLFSLTADWYQKETDDILFPQPIPGSVGLSAPTVNYGAMLNRGVDLQLGHLNSIGELQYDISAGVSKNINKVTRLLSPNIGGNSISVEGAPWNSHYLYEWVGIFQSQEDIENSPTQLYEPKPGDLKFRDQNGDGLINSEDKMIVDGRNPDFTYSLNMNLDWRAFDVSTVFYGVHGRYNYERNWSREPFSQGSPPTVDWRNAWTPENNSNSMPALYLGFNGYPPITGYNSTFFLHNASYFRLKNITLGYTLPTSPLGLGVRSMRIYVSSDNLFTITPYDGLDPEREVGGGQFNASFYPQLRTFTGGIEINI